MKKVKFFVTSILLLYGCSNVGLIALTVKEVSKGVFTLQEAPPQNHTQYNEVNRDSALLFLKAIIYPVR